MACYWETLWTFKTANFTVKWQISPCDDLDLSWDETGETAENIASGLWTAFDSRVIVTYRGREVGADYLGQSIYENPEDFRRGSGYFSDMVAGAIAEARAEMRRDAPYIRAA
jgi:hypothetical protein